METGWQKGPEWDEPRKSSFTCVWLRFSPVLQKENRSSCRNYTKYCCFLFQSDTYILNKLYLSGILQGADVHKIAWKSVPEGAEWEKRLQVEKTLRQQRSGLICLGNLLGKGNVARLWVHCKLALICREASKILWFSLVVICCQGRRRLCQVWHSDSLKENPVFSENSSEEAAMPPGLTVIITITNFFFFNYIILPVLKLYFVLFFIF